MAKSLIFWDPNPNMSKIKVKRSETKFLSFYKTLEIIEFVSISDE